MPSVLIVTGAFAPSRQIGGRRAERMALHLARLGWQVTVLSPRPAYMAPVDETHRVTGPFEHVMTEALAPRVLVRQLAALRPRAKTPAATGPAATGPAAQAQQEPSLAQRAKSQAGKWLRQLEFPDESLGWLPFALAAMRNRKFDVVLATLPPFTPALIASHLAQRMGARLVLDYRDPWSEVCEPGGRHGGDNPVAMRTYRRHLALENRCLQQAALVVAVTPSICAMLATRTQAPVELVTNALDAPRPSEPLDQANAAAAGPLRLVYAGSLAYGRSLAPVFEAIAAVRKVWTPERLRLVYAGPHGAGMVAAATEAGVLDYLDDLGEVSGARARQLLHGAAAGIVSISARTDYGYPGKLFEIAAAGCPIWLLGPEHCDAANLVRHHDLGWVDAEAGPAAATLHAIVSGQRPAPHGLAALTAEATMQRLDQLLRKTL